MTTTEKAQEIEAVLSSATFSEAPILARLLKYLFDNHLSEVKGSLNEYRIGVEALGRPADFDPATNSGVRVEMHRLRARLRKYYETEGAGHPLKIALTEGRYGLQFVRSGDVSAAAQSEPEEHGDSGAAPEGELSQQDDAPLKPSTASTTARQPENRRIPRISPKGIAIAGTAVLALAVAVWASFGALSRQRGAKAPAAPSTTAMNAAPAANAPDGSIRILAGYPNGKYVDRDGNVWEGDRYFTGGGGVELKIPFLQGTSDPIIYRTARIGDFSYDIPVKPGVYELRMHFVETTFGPGTLAGRGESSRVFDVLLNRKPLLRDFDILSAAGGSYRAYTRVVKDISAGNDAMIHLTFNRIIDNPQINAIELAPETGHGMNPVRIVMQQNSFVDHAGRLWGADQYGFGGVLDTHHKPAANTGDPHLFDGERFGHFDYQIPVAPGHYAVTLYFSEAYFGSDTPASDKGGRFFDVYANGTALLRHFSIYEKAGGPNLPVVETFHGIEPNAAGLIVLSFVPVNNYACVDAIEVADESE